MNTKKQRNDLDLTLAMLEAHPLIQQLKTEKATEVLKQRIETAERLEELKREMETILPGFQGEVAALDYQLSRHDEARKVIQCKLVGAKLALANEKLRISSEMNAMESELFETCDSRIDEAIQFFYDKHEELLKTSPSKDVRTGKTNPFTLTKTVVTYSNIKAIQKALGYCLQAVSELKKMKLRAEVEVDRIELFKANIPDITEMTEITTNRLLPKGPESVNPLHLLPSDSEYDWHMGTIMEKVRKVMDV